MAELSFRGSNDMQTLLTDTVYSQHSYDAVLQPIRKLLFAAPQSGKQGRPEQRAK